MANEKLKIYVGEYGNKSRVLFCGRTIPGVCNARVDVDASELSKATITLNAMNCEIIHENFEYDDNYLYWRAQWLISEIEEKRYRYELSGEESGALDVLLQL